MECCLCFGESPSSFCNCACHRQEDCEHWEIMAFVWIYDAPSDEAREEEWQRFCSAYPEHANEDCSSFWDRIQKTRWHHKHHHHYHHHHHHHDYDEEC